MSKALRNAIVLSIRELKNNPPLGVFAELHEGSMRLLKARIVGPEETPWEGGVFNLKITIPEGFPNTAPLVVFEGIIPFHANVYANTGAICVDMLQDKWSPVFTIAQVLVGLQSLLAEPNIDSPANPIAAALFLSDRESYNQKVRELIRATFFHARCASPSSTAENKRLREPCFFESVAPQAPTAPPVAIPLAALSIPGPAAIPLAALPIAVSVATTIPAPVETHIPAPVVISVAAPVVIPIAAPVVTPIAAPCATTIADAVAKPVHTWPQNRKCDHNNWDSVRCIAQSLTLECRSCQSRIVCNKTDVVRCPNFHYGYCSKHPSCSETHIYRSNKGAEHFKYAEGEPSAVDLTRERALREEIERLNVVVGQMKGKGEFGHTTEISDRLNQLSAILSEHSKKN